MAEFIQNAKQILRGKDHIADCIDAETAEMIVQAMNESRGLHIQNDTHVALGRARERQFARCREERDSQPDQIATYLDAQADKRSRRRQFTQGIRFAAQEVRARMWEADEAPPEGVRARYNEETAHG